MAHGCTPCAGRRCIDAALSSTAQGLSGSIAAGALVTASFDASAHLEHGESFNVVVRVHTSARGDAVRSCAHSTTAELVYDTTPPDVGNVSDAHPCRGSAAGMSYANECVDKANDVQYMLPTDTIAAWWTPFMDPESNVVALAYCVGSSPLLCDVAPMVETSANATAALIPLNGTATHGAMYCVSVEAKNAAGLRSERASSDCVRITEVPPLTLYARMGSDPSVHLDEQISTSLLFGTATGVRQEGGAPIDGFEWCFASVAANVSQADGNLTEWGMAACDIEPLQFSFAEQVTSDAPYSR